MAVSALIDNPDIAKLAVDQFVGQSNMLFQHSILILGAIPTLAGLAGFGRRSVDRNVRLSGLGLAATSMTFSGLSIFFGYCFFGALVQLSPQLMTISYDLSKPFTEQAVAGGSMSLIPMLSLLQFATFFLSVFFGAIFLWKNMKWEGRP